MVKAHIGVLLAVLVFFVQAFLVPHAGMSWDEPSSFFVGRANLMYWLTGDRQYVINIWDKTKFPDSPIQYIYGEDIYPPFPFVVASAFSYFLAERWHLINFIDAHHLGEIAIASVGVWAMFGLAVEVGLSVPGAIAVAAAYTLYPSIWGPMRNDAKDIPLLSMLTVASFCFVKWFRLWQQKNYNAGILWGIAFAVSYGLAGASKPTAAIFVAIAGMWILTSAVRSPVFRKRLGSIRQLLGTIGLLLLLSAGTFLLAWPWLWDNPIGKLAYIFSFFKTVGYNMPTPYFGTIYHAAVNLPRDYAFTILLVQTPLEILFFAVIGFFWSITAFIVKKKTLPWLFVVWFTLSMGRFLIPGVIIYAWVRHFIDAMPAFFLLVGFGIEYAASAIVSIVRILDKKRVLPMRSVGYLIVLFGAAIALHQAVISWRLFPFETSYFNMIVGGTKGVADHWLFDVGQGAGVKEAMEYVARDSGGKPVVVYPCLMGHLARFYAPKNVTFTRYPEQANYSLAPNSPSWFEGALTFGRTQQSVGYTIKRAGADLFYVYKYTKPSGWRCGWETISNYVW